MPTICSSYNAAFDATLHASICATQHPAEWSTELISYCATYFCSQRTAISSPFSATNTTTHSSTYEAAIFTAHASAVCPAYETAYAAANWSAVEGADPTTDCTTDSFTFEPTYKFANRSAIFTADILAIEQTHYDSKLPAQHPTHWSAILTAVRRADFTTFSRANFSPDRSTFKSTHR